MSENKNNENKELNDKNEIKENETKESDVTLDQENTALEKVLEKKSLWSLEKD